VFAMRNDKMVERIEAVTPDGAVRFVVAGDSGAWWDPTADGIYSELVRQVAELDPAPAFFANLGDFAGPGTADRHEHYLGLMDALPIPNLCVVGNHDLDHADGWVNFERIHGSVNFTFACGHTRFVAMHSQASTVGEIVITRSAGPRDEDLVFLDRELAAAAEPNRVVLMHMPPHLGGHYAPHADWGFEEREEEFLALLRAHGVKLVCCAHGLAFDRHVVDGITFVMSGGGGTGLCSHYRGVCTEGDGRPEDRGALFHAVELAVTPDGAVSGRVLQAFDRAGAETRAF
jgi:Calcineurin-like phosphoesterase